jgi:hypothetical protein
VDFAGSLTAAARLEQKSHFEIMTHPDLAAERASGLR